MSTSISSIIDGKSTNHVNPYIWKIHKSSINAYTGSYKYIGILHDLSLSIFLTSMKQAWKINRWSSLL